jgi:hypothetical protein
MLNEKEYQKILEDSLGDAVLKLLDAGIGPTDIIRLAIQATTSIILEKKIEDHDLNWEVMDNA